VNQHGARVVAEGVTRFSLWAPGRTNVTLVLDDGRRVGLDRAGDTFAATVEGTGPGTRYRYLLDGEGPFADPASRAQPDGVHGPSVVVAPGPGVAADWRGVPLAAQVICELHVGTFSADGTFAGVVAGLDHLVGAGFSAIELMPIGEFPGRRNWGYDGVFPWAAQSSYGGPDGLVALVRAAHEHGLAVIVDVVYNHIGPEGAVQEHFGPYFTDRYATPWGRAVNVDGPGSDGVRDYFIGQACYFVGELGVDGLRLDAVHEIVDTSASPFLAELNEALHAIGRTQGRTVTVVAESPANDPRLTTPVAELGLGCDGSWDDDFHHALRATVTGDRDRWFADFDGISDLAAAMQRGWVLTGRASSTFGRRHGRPLPTGFSGSRLVAFAQNHDQIGNAGFGERLAARLPIEAQFPISAAVLLAPFVPLRFMGEEYGERAPFNFFTDFGDPGLVEAVRTGRAAEVGGRDPNPTDPQDPATFEASRIDPAGATSGVARELLDWHRELLRLRRDEPALGSLEPDRGVAVGDLALNALILTRRADPALGAATVTVLWRCAVGEAGPAELACPNLAGKSLEVLTSYGAPSCKPGATLEFPATGTPRVELERFAVVVLADRDDRGRRG